VQVVAPGKAPAAWQKINVGVGGSDSWGSSGACVERGGQGRIFHYFNWMNIYDPVSNMWTKGAVRGRRENYGSDHDTDNDIIWMSPGGPAFEQNNSAFPPVTANSRTLRYNPATDTFTAHTSSFGTLQSVLAWCRIRKVAYVFGGFIQGGVPLHAMSTNPPGSWAPKNPAGTPPLITTDACKYSTVRGGIDSRDGKLWFIGDNQGFHQYDPDANKWSLVPTTGTKPENNAICMLDELHNAIVCYCGMDIIADPGPVKQNTMILDLATLAWSQGPRGAAVSPPAVPVVAQIPLYDRVRHRSLILVYNPQTGGTDVWQLKWE
jgi:hypothetical protein